SPDGVKAGARSNGVCCPVRQYSSPLPIHKNHFATQLTSATSAATNKATPTRAAAMMWSGLSSPRSSWYSLFLRIPRNDHATALMVRSNDLRRGADGVLALM